MTADRSDPTVPQPVEPRRTRTRTDAPIVAARRREAHSPQARHDFRVADRAAPGGGAGASDTRVPGLYRADCDAGALIPAYRGARMLGSIVSRGSLGRRCVTLTAIAIALVGCRDPSDPGRAPSTIIITRNGPATVGVVLRPSSTRVSQGTVVLLGSDGFSDPGYALTAHASITSSATGRTLRLTVTSTKLRGIFPQTAWFNEYEVTVSVPSGRYEVELIRQRDAGPTDLVEYTGRVVVP